MLMVLVVWTRVLFRRIDDIAGLLLLPYVAWLTFAAVPNAGFVVRSN